MTLNLKNKTALITGSTDGLGKLTALELAGKGVNIIIHGRNEDKIKKILEELKEINKEGDFDSILCDFNNPQSIKEAFSKIEKLDILINNAGVWSEGNTIDIKEEKIIELSNVNLESYLLVTRTLLPILLKSEYSQILNVVSVAGYEIPSGYYHTIYTATKYGLQGFSEALAKEFEGKNLRVMGFYPGGMDTKIFEKAGENYENDKAWMFDPLESVEAILFMLTRNPKVNVKRMDLINHLQ